MIPLTGTDPSWSTVLKFSLPHHILATVPLSTTYSVWREGRQEESVKRAIRQAELSQQASSNLLEHPL